jgi:hypothetical protein
MVMLIFTVPFKFDTNPGFLWSEIMALDFWHEGRDQGEGGRSDGVMMSFFSSQDVTVNVALAGSILVILLN